MAASKKTKPKGGDPHYSPMPAWVHAIEDPRLQDAMREVIDARSWAIDSGAVRHPRAAKLLHAGDVLLGRIKKALKGGAPRVDVVLRQAAASLRKFDAAGRGDMATWREAFAQVRAALRAAETLKGEEREHALVRVCRMLVEAEKRPPVPFGKEDGLRVHDASTRAYDLAERRLELAVARVVGCCIGCWAARRLPEEDPSRSRTR